MLYELSNIIVSENATKITQNRNEFKTLTSRRCLARNRTALVHLVGRHPSVPHNRALHSLLILQRDPELNVVPIGPKVPPESRD